MTRRGIDTPERETFARAVGARIRELRLADGLTGADIAAGAGISRAFVTDLEYGRSQITLEVAVRIADILGVDIRDLMVGVVRPGHGPRRPEVALSATKPQSSTAYTSDPAFVEEVTNPQVGRG